MTGAPRPEAHQILERARGGLVDTGSYAFGYHPKAGWVNLGIRIENAVFAWGLICFLSVAGMLSMPSLEGALRGALTALDGHGSVPDMAWVIFSGLALLFPVILVLWVRGPLGVVRHAAQNMLVVTPTHIHQELGGKVNSYAVADVSKVALVRAERWPHQKPVLGGHLLMAALGLGWWRQCAAIRVGRQMEKVQIGKYGEFGPAGPIVSAIGAFTARSALKTQSQSHLAW